jgi:hypothetical protein
MFDGVYAHQLHESGGSAHEDVDDAKVLRSVIVRGEDASSENLVQELPSRYALWIIILLDQLYQRSVCGRGNAYGFRLWGQTWQMKQGREDSILENGVDSGGMQYLGWALLYEVG